MKKTIAKNKITRKHLTRDDRIRIETMLNYHQSIRAIAKELKCSPSTILREIKNHTQVQHARSNDCILRSECKHTNVCKSNNCFHKCYKCNVCSKYCPDYTKALCDHLQQSPYVCNGCSKNANCSYGKVYYRGGLANKEYREVLIGRRNGFNLTYEEISLINELVTPLIKNGLSPYHIKQLLGDKLPISESTLRRLIDLKELDVRKIDLREGVKRKPHSSKSRKMHNELVSKLKEGRLYKDYLAYISENDVSAIQMDCVEGKKEDNATLLTLHFPSFHMQLAFIMQYHTASCVVKELDIIEEVLGKQLFAKVFPLILTENGHEFTDIIGMERSIYGGQRTKVFFCEPNRSDEKGQCENNHKYIRYIIPKGTSLESYSQIDISLMMNHINSFKRKSIYGKTPYELAMTTLPKDFFILLGLESISPEKIILKPSLISHKKIMSV